MTSPYVSPDVSPSSAPASVAPLALLTARILAALVGAVALLLGVYGLFMVVAGSKEAADEDSLAGLAVVVGVAALVVAVPVLALSAAVVISRRRVVVGVCGLLLAVVLLVGTAMAFGGGLPWTALGLLLSAVMATSSLVVLASRAP